jgi:hypothetical protein
MKSLKLWLGLIFSTSLFSAVAMAETVVEPVTELDFLGKLLALIGSAKGLTSIALALAIVQLVIMFFKSSFADKLFTKLTSQMKWLLVTAMTLVAGYLTAVTTGQTSGQAIVAMLALPMFQEFLFQIYKQFVEKKAVPKV